MASTPPPRAVLFDVDGTLVDTNALHAVAWREAFRHFGHDFPLDLIRTQIGKGGDNLIPTLLPDLDEAAREEIDAWRGDLFKRDYLPSAVPFPGVRDLFERLVEDEIRIVLASSSSKAEVAFHLDLIAAEDLVAAFTSKDDVESSKPCPDIFEAALAKVAPIPPAEVLVVGDSPWDIKAARRAGLKAVGFLSGGFAAAELRAEGAIALYEGAAHLLADYDGSPFARHG
ncbi:MAG: HAD family hydrolase [Alphaproteobacteria bacterium]|nr:HAD family hydrolase [Alphaproteobacteria bacterium]